MAKALYFEDPIDLCDFIRTAGSGLLADTPYDLYHIVHPEIPGHSALLLAGLDPGRKRRGETFDRVNFERDGQTVTLTTGRGRNTDEHRTPLQIHKQARSLLELIQLIPWKPREIRTQEALSGHVIFWLRSSELLPLLVNASLKLGNDHIQYAHLTKNSEEETLLRIQHPSYFLIQRCLEEHAAEVELYHVAAEDLFLQWGFDHPLHELWNDAKRADGPEKWHFFRHDGDHTPLPPLRWIDVYDLTEFTLDFPHDETYAQSSNSPVKFEVPLTITPRISSQPAPELWLLNEAGQSQLESLLQLIDEEQIRPYELAVQTSEDLPDDLLFVREKRAGSKRHHLEFSGQAFAHHQGLNNFLLPVNYNLLPPLRRDLYRHLFHLEPNVLTILIPFADGEFRSVKVRERAFQPLTSFLDYVVEREALALQERIEESVFDFQEYLRSPSHPGLKNPREPKPDSGLKKSRGADAPTKERPEEEAMPRASLDSLLKDHAGNLDESQLEGLQKQELDLERILVKEQSRENWQVLAACKGLLGKSGEALTAAIECLWLSEEATLAESAIQLLHEQLDQWKEPLRKLNRIDGSEPDDVLRSALFEHLRNGPDADAASSEIDQWLTQTSAFLSKHRDRLRAKERWLAWGNVLHLNRDERKEAQIREEIVSQIGEKGMGIDETPSFIRTRIFLDRKQKDGPDGEPNSSGAEQVLGNLQSLSKIAKAVKIPLLRSTFEALLARSYAQTGATSEALAIIDHWSAPNSDLDLWSTLFHAQALEGSASQRAESMYQQLDSVLESAHKETQSAIQEHREIHQRRSEIESPAAFLAQENRSRSYPVGGLQSMGPLYELSEALLQAMAEGEEVAAVRVTEKMMTLESPKDYDDSVKLPQLVEVLVEALGTYKWGSRGASLIPVFERFALDAPAFLNKPDPFYLSLLHANLANGLFIAEDPSGAKREVERAIKALASTGTELDFIDGCAAVLGTIEQLPLFERITFLEDLLLHFSTSFDREESHFLQQPRLFAVIVRLLDQFVQAAASKDRISLNQFKNYQLQDEFLILQRIQRESFCQATTS